MRSSLLDTGLIRVTVRYVKALKPGGPLFYYRRIPEGVRPHYEGKQFFRQSLRTRDLAEATRKAAKLAAEHDALWPTLQSREGQRAGLTTAENREAAKALLTALNLMPGELSAGTPLQEGRDPSDILDGYFSRRYGEAYLQARHEPWHSMVPVESFWTPAEAEAVRLLKEDPRKPQTLLSDALAIYLREHDKGDHAKFAADATRAIGHVISAVGDLPLTAYQRDHAKKVRDLLLKGGNKTATARRRLNSIKAVFNKGLIEFNLRAHGNPFEKLQIVKEAEDASEREAFTHDELRAIAHACRSKDDDIRHIVALQADTGARLGEIVGLRVSDVALDHETPHIFIREHTALGRTLKNANSEREVPLIGEALWAAQRALQAAQQHPQASGWLFPRYAVDGEVKATSASMAINKWLRGTLQIEKTTHSFRHAMRDRLRHVGVSEEFQNLIGGWGVRTIGQRYGQGYLLRQLREELEKVAAAEP